MDAVLFVTPEYNCSIPGALKHAIDWASRPWGKNSFARKPSGSIGTAVALQQLRGMLCFCNSPMMNTLDAHIQFHPGLITEDGTVTNDSTAEFLSNYMKELQLFVERVLTVHPREGRFQVRGATRPITNRNSTALALVDSQPGPGWPRFSARR